MNTVATMSAPTRGQRRLQFALGCLGFFMIVGVLLVASIHHQSKQLPRSANARKAWAHRLAKAPAGTIVETPNGLIVLIDQPHPEIREINTLSAGLGWEIIHILASEAQRIILPTDPDYDQFARRFVHPQATLTPSATPTPTATPSRSLPSTNRPVHFRPPRSLLASGRISFLYMQIIRMASNATNFCRGLL